MKLVCYQLQENNCITAVSRQDINSKTGTYWLEIANATSDELASELTILNLHPLIIEDCLATGYSTMIDRYETAVYVEFPINRAEPYGRTIYLSLIFTPNLLISIRQGDLPGMDALSALLQNENFMYDSDLRALSYHVFNYFIGEDLTAVRHLRDQVDALTHAFETDAATIEVETVAAMKRRVSSTSDVSEDRFYSLKSFLSIRPESLDIDKEKPYLHDLISDAEYTFRMIQRLEDRLRDLHGDFQLMAHDETEKRLRILTLISAILLPLTLISGIFGMNFETMSVLHWEYGYALTMGLMGLITIAMIIYFMRHGWFD